MALVGPLLQVLATLATDLAIRRCESREGLSLGYPDVITTQQQLFSLFGDSAVSRLKFRDDADSILRWHSIGDPDARVPEAHSLFSLLGYGFETVDIVAARGGEIILDLNEPAPSHLAERYAIALDAGTIEHCFNIAQAAKNLAQMVARHGVVVQFNPLNMYNHGFYNLGPTWYHDFYESNGFAVDSLRLVWDVASTPRESDVPPYARFRNAPENSMLLAVAQRTEVRPIRWPTQRKYRDNLSLAG